MGRDKALLELNGEPMIVRAARLVESVAANPVIVGAPERFGELGLEVIADDWPAAGPLGGIATALRASSARWNLIVACDLPYLTKPWLDYAIGRAFASRAEAVVPMGALGAEPLCAIYHERAEAAIR